MALQTGPYTVVVSIYTLDCFETTQAQRCCENCHLKMEYGWLKQMKEPIAVPFKLYPEITFVNRRGNTVWDKMSFPFISILLF